MEPKNFLMKPLKIRKKKQEVFAAIGQVPNLFDSFSVNMQWCKFLIWGITLYVFRNGEYAHMTAGKNAIKFRRIHWIVMSRNL